MNSDNSGLTRREVIRLMGLGMASVYLGGCASVSAGNTEAIAPLNAAPVASPMAALIAANGPFDRTLGAVAPRRFSGDEPSLAHKVLWNKADFIKEIGGLPAPSEFTDVVVVGGGISGLLSTYFLREHKPILLEQASRFGGNSRGESWQGLDYSLATAYFAVPVKGTSIYKFFEEVGLLNKYKLHGGSDPIFIDGKRYDNIWTDGTVPESKAHFVLLNKHFEDMANGLDGTHIPVLPPVTQADREYANHLDQLSMKEYLEKLVGGPLHPHVEHVIENYFWSAAAASYKEVGASMGLNFFVGDFDRVAVLPGGNGAIAEAALQALYQQDPSSLGQDGRFRSSSLVFDVRIHRKKRVHVTYLNAQNKAVTIEAKSVVMSCPKFVAAKLMDHLEPQRRQAIDNINYRSYIVANLLVNKKIEQNFYDLFVFNKEEMKIQNLEKAAHKQGFTDAVYGSFLKPDTGRTVLTLFRGYPYDGARQEIYNPSCYEKVRGEFEAQIKRDLLPMFGVAESDIADLRLARWGHPLPVCKTGNLKHGLVDIIRKPFQKRIFFAEQDNWTLPSFECAFHEAETWAPEVAKVLLKDS